MEDPVKAYKHQFQSHQQAATGHLLLLPLPYRICVGILLISPRAGRSARLADRGGTLSDQTLINTHISFYSSQIPTRTQQ